MFFHAQFCVAVDPVSRCSLHLLTYGIDLDVGLSLMIILIMSIPCARDGPESADWTEKRMVVVDEMDDWVVLLALGMGMVLVVQLDDVVEELLEVLASCSRSGLIDEGWRTFSQYKFHYGVEASVEHYACMVDLLGRFGNLEEAHGLLQNMKLQDETASVWGVLLAGCVKHKNVSIREIASHYGIAITRAKMRELDLAKIPRCSWITIAGTLHKFYQGYHFHPLTKVVCETLNGMIKVLMWPHDFEL
ncbi:unnamed protein product [Dovyalis caffra]|uniref:Pentatricopeptide repeat-containing protein n=1 Tax=Dovyalis caffra TaxID=77055 RepID=A0AAV1SPU9_9ROSI|nr:unnamed protein product [Dovyalis caffra]